MSCGVVNRRAERAMTRAQVRLLSKQQRSCLQSGSVKSVLCLSKDIVGKVLLMRLKRRLLLRHTIVYGQTLPSVS